MSKESEDYTDVAGVIGAIFVSILLSFLVVGMITIYVNGDCKECQRPPTILYSDGKEQYAISLGKDKYFHVGGYWYDKDGARVRYTKSGILDKYIAANYFQEKLREAGQ